MTRALTVRQPWAWCIAHGGKDVENRPTRWAYRGPLLIHAGKALDLDATLPISLCVPDPDTIERSAVVAVATLASVHTPPTGCNRLCRRWGREGEHHLRLEDVEALPEPVPWARGALGLWRPPADLLAAVRAQLPHRLLPDPT